MSITGSGSVAAIVSATGSAGFTTGFGVALGMVWMVLVGGGMTDFGVLPSAAVGAAPGFGPRLTRSLSASTCSGSNPCNWLVIPAKPSSLQYARMSSGFEVQLFRKSEHSKFLILLFRQAVLLWGTPPNPELPRAAGIAVRLIVPRLSSILIFWRRLKRALF